MRTVASYLFPVVMTLAGLITAAADIFQDSRLAYGLALSLLGVGVFTLVMFRGPFVARWTRTAFPELGNSFPVVSFSASCAILAVAVIGFANLSERLASSGGAIASGYPEIAVLQKGLGIVSQQVQQVADTTAEISDQTSFLVEASGRWVGFSRVYGHGQEGTYNFDARLENSSSFVFERVSVLVRDADNPSHIYIDERDLTVVPHDSLMWLPEMDAMPDRVEVCVSGMRRDGNVWTMDRRIYGNPDTTTYDHSWLFRVVETSGLQLADPNTFCA